MPTENSFDIDKIARLACLEVQEGQKQALQERLSAILKHVESIQSLNIDAIEPTIHILPIQNVWREDTPTATFSQDEALLNAPAKRQQQIVVPKVIK